LRLDHVWCADITYVPVTQVFFYLVAVMDWATRHVLTWRLSNTMHATFCVDALDDALGWRAPEILNTDQGAQFTSEAFADRVLGAGVAFSMDGRGRFLDNIFIERLWRSLKYEAVYLHELRDRLDACRIIGSWIDFYNEVCPHSALNGFALGLSNEVGPPIVPPIFLDSSLANLSKSRRGGGRCLGVRKGRTVRAAWGGRPASPSDGARGGRPRWWCGCCGGRTSAR